VILSHAFRRRAFGCDTTDPIDFRLYRRNRRDVIPPYSSTRKILKRNEHHSSKELPSIPWMLWECLRCHPGYKLVVVKCRFSISKARLVKKQFPRVG
jgi:hypothetical protein